MKRHFNNSFLRHFLSWTFLLGTVISFTSCAKTMNVYHPPRLDLTQFGRLGMITFTDNAQPSVGDYATEQFQNQIHAAQTGIPIVQLGSKDAVLKSVGSNRLDSEAMAKIGQRYKVSAVFTGNIVYSDVETNVDLKDIIGLKARADTLLHATLSVNLFETEGGASVWSRSTSWQRKLGEVSVNKSTGVSIGTEGYDDAYRKLIPDMVYDVTNDFRGRYIRERVNN